MVDVSKYIERAEQEVKRRNFDHAMTLYREILQIDPNCGPARSGLRLAALKKFEKRYPSGIERGVLNLPVRMLLPFASLFKAHGWTANLCESALARDPRNARLNHRLGHALLALGHANGAEAAFRVVTEFDSKDAESLKILGRLYTERKELDRALECFEKALKINPRDQEAGRMRKNLAAEGAIQRGGYETAGHSRDLAKNQRQMKEAERSKKIVRTRDDVEEAIADLKEQLGPNPTDAQLLRRLGELLVQNQQTAEALQTLEKASELAPKDSEILDRLGETRVRRLEEQLVQAEQEARDGEEGAEDRIRRIRRELRNLQVEEGRRRVQTHPTDMTLRFQLGSALLQNEDLDGAIEQFQQSVRDPKHKIASLQLLGRAFSAKGILDLAVKQLREAADQIAGMTDRRKEILYELALVHERDGSPADAVSIYKQIYEADISFRDVGQRIQTLGA